MIFKIAAMLILMSSILLIDLRFFFPVAIIILFILKSIEKDLNKKDSNHILQGDAEVSVEK